MELVGAIYEVPAPIIPASFLRVLFSEEQMLVMAAIASGCFSFPVGTSKIF